jgi:hypothetical protein
MKKVIIKETPSEITATNAVSKCYSGNKGFEIVFSYKSAGGTGYRVLNKLNNCPETWGWVPVDRIATPPCYMGDSLQIAVELAAKNRNVYMFDNWTEMIEAMYKKSF